MEYIPPELNMDSFQIYDGVHTSCTKSTFAVVQCTKRQQYRTRCSKTDACETGTAMSNRLGYQQCACQPYWAAQGKEAYNVGSVTTCIASHTARHKVRRLTMTG